MRTRYKLPIWADLFNLVVGLFGPKFFAAPNRGGGSGGAAPFLSGTGGGGAGTDPFKGIIGKGGGGGAAPFLGGGGGGTDPFKGIIGKGGGGGGGGAAPFLSALVGGGAGTDPLEGIIGKGGGGGGGGGGGTAIFDANMGDDAREDAAISGRNLAGGDCGRDGATANYI